jgi:hypothetical protein
MYFEIIGALSEIEVIAEGRAVRERRQLRSRYGGRRWRKLKGIGIAHGVGKVRFKIKRLLE